MTSTGLAGLFYGAERSTVDVDLGIASALDRILHFADELDDNEFLLSANYSAGRVRRFAGGLTASTE